MDEDEVITEKENALGIKDFKEEINYQDVAFHYEKAEEIENEIIYLKKAADYAKAQYHNQEAEKILPKPVPAGTAQA